MANRLEIRTTPDKPANYEVSKPDSDGFVAFTERKEMFKYLNMVLDKVPDEHGASDEEVSEAVENAEA